MSRKNLSLRYNIQDTIRKSCGDILSHFLIKYLTAELMSMINEKYYLVSKDSIKSFHMSSNDNVVHYDWYE